MTGSYFSRTLFNSADPFLCPFLLPLLCDTVAAAEECSSVVLKNLEVFLVLTNGANGLNPAISFAEKLKNVTSKTKYIMKPIRNEQ